MKKPWNTLDLDTQINLLMTNFFHHIEISQLICRANQLTGFYMMGTLVVKRLRFCMRSLWKDSPCFDGSSNNIYFIKNKNLQNFFFRNESDKGPYIKYVGEGTGGFLWRSWNIFGIYWWAMKYFLKFLMGHKIFSYVLFS